MKPSGVNYRAAFCCPNSKAIPLLKPHRLTFGCSGASAAEEIIPRVPKDLKENTLPVKMNAGSRFLSPFDRSSPDSA
jgi:hypothetical protein